MSKIEQIEGGQGTIRCGTIGLFRAWFSEFDANAWDRQFEADVKSGKLDKLAERALREHSAGRSTEL